MKRYTKILLFTSLLVVVLNVLPKFALAQIDPGEDPDAPIDGGISLLVAAGVGYGVKKARDSRKAKAGDNTNK
ncbi:PID-CTERM protein-sorting domain-containing protein [Ferruginibacter sp. SUN002]|uniref:PID-CTERM protein-sorting domain-containing protein n=1 Tax=Ferruginibacter sp. SUN002 TaxID=2937789 RepID=UPI003D366333